MSATDPGAPVVGPPVIWITGRPASGKTTLGRRLVEAIRQAGYRATLIDSDEVRRVVTPHPSYTDEERALFYRAMAYTASRLAAEGVVPVVAATAHRRRYIQWARQICPTLRLIYARCPLEVCQQRDPKGLYARAQDDPDNTLPGVGVAFEEPLTPDVVIDTAGPVGDAEIRALVPLSTAS